MQKRNAKVTTPSDGVFELAISIDIHGPINGNQPLIRITTRGISKTKTSFHILIIKSVEPELYLVSFIITPINKAKARNSLDITHSIQDQLALLLAPPKTPIPSKYPTRLVFGIANKGVTNGRAIRRCSPAITIRQTINPNVSRAFDWDRGLVSHKPA